MSSLIGKRVLVQDNKLTLVEGKENWVSDGKPWSGEVVAVGFKEEGACLVIMLDNGLLYSRHIGKASRIGVILPEPETLQDEVFNTH